MKTILGGRDHRTDRPRISLSDFKLVRGFFIERKEDERFATKN